MKAAWVAAQIVAAVRLARREPDAMEGFDVSIEGFWRSFWAMLICLPGFALLAPTLDGYTPGEAAFWLREIAGYVVGWLIFPLLMVPVSRFLDVADRYVPLIVALNWAAVVQTAAFVAAVTLGRVLPQPLSALVVLVATILIVLYQYHAIRTSLAATAGLAAGLTALDIVTSFMMEGLFAG